jgi:hypothetical protein
MDVVSIRLNVYSFLAALYTLKGYSDGGAKKAPLLITNRREGGGEGGREGGKEEECTHTFGDAEELEDGVVPGQGGDVHEEGAGGVGYVGDVRLKKEVGGREGARGRMVRTGRCTTFKNCSTRTERRTKTKNHHR